MFSLASCPTSVNYYVHVDRDLMKIFWWAFYVVAMYFKHSIKPETGVHVHNSVLSNSKWFLQIEGNFLGENWVQSLDQTKLEQVFSNLQIVMLLQGKLFLRKCVNLESQNQTFKLEQTRLLNVFIGILVMIYNFL